MTCTLHEAFDQFKKHNPTRKLGVTSFKKLKPVNVKKVSETSHKTCLCQACSNVALKAEVLKNVITGKDIPMQIMQSKKDTANITMCQYTSDYPKPACLERTCPDCGPHKLTEYYKDVITGRENNEIKWYRWAVIKVQKHGKEKRITSCITEANLNVM